MIISVTIRCHSQISEIIDKILRYVRIQYCGGYLNSLVKTRLNKVCLYIGWLVVLGWSPKERVGSMIPGKQRQRD